MTRRLPRPNPTETAWLGLAAYVACADWELIRHHHDTLSTFARSHPIATAVVCALLSAHLLTDWRFDPLHLAGDWARRH